MKIVEIVYIKNDLEYIYEFVEYYLNLGVDFIHICYFRSDTDNIDIYEILDEFKDKICIKELTYYNEHQLIEYYFLIIFIIILFFYYY